MSRMKHFRFALVIFALTLSPTTWGAGSVFGKVAMTDTNASALFLYIDTAPSGVPACGSETIASRRFAISITTPEGRAMAANALLAFSSNRSLLVTGTGTCGVWGDTETIQWLRVYP